MALLPALALDVGEARIGFAVSDERGTFVFGRGYHRRVVAVQHTRNTAVQHTRSTAVGSSGSNVMTDVEAVRELALKEKVCTIVIGLPVRTDGADSPQTARVREFAKTLEAFMVADQVNIEFMDERFTTKLGQQRLLTQNKSTRREKGKLDEASAIAILETWLAKNKNL